ncbi:MAG: phospho-N-acetylmuramoyl-pentapeptide-transferase [Bacteroidetes bacterium]|nr:phospho-N-acetylmuramoyl-pentapeptide-transferase [Bacteroidota bacterium]
MLYHLFKYLDKEFNIPGARLFSYISFRAGATAVLSLFIVIFFGKYIIKKLSYLKIKNDVRFDTINQNKDRKRNTPTMGGIIIIAATLIPVLLFASLTNIYIILLITTTLIMGTIGLIDDYIKVFKKNREGIAVKFKIIGQCCLGVIVGSTLYFHKDVVIRKFKDNNFSISELKEENPQNKISFEDIKSTKTNVPFFKNNELDYSKIIKFFIPFFNVKYTWIFYILLIICVIIGSTNGANFTDGLDGLAAGTSATIGLTLAILAYLSGNIVFSKYLNILYIPGSAELTVFCTAFVGACIGFLWFNAYPSSIFMGDTGSLTIGGIIAVIAISIRKELLIPLLCGIYFIEVLSVILQVYYFKFTKRKYGEGKRIFKMAPLHHHFQQQGIHEAKIVVRFLIIGILLAILTLVTLKIR